MNVEINIFEASSQMLVNTPWWCWLIFAYLFSKGIAISKTSKIKARKLLIFPVIFFLFSVHVMHDILIVPTNFDLTQWMVAILIGGVLGCIQLSLMKLKIDREDLKVEIPGSFIPLAVFVFIFIANYFFYYKIALNSKVIEQIWYRLGLLYIVGLALGFFMGRYLRAVYVLIQRSRKARL